MWERRSENIARKSLALPEFKDGYAGWYELDLDYLGHIPLDLNPSDNAHRIAMNDLLPACFHLTPELYVKLELIHREEDESYCPASVCA